MSLNLFFFGLLAILLITSGLAAVLSKNALKSAVALVINFFVLAGVYLTLNAQFIAAAQVLVYTGAIMVIIIFVIMLLNVTNDKIAGEFMKRKVSVAILVAISLLAVLAGIFSALYSPNPALAKNSMQLGTAEYLGKVLYTDYIIPVIAIGMLLTAAIIGAVVLAKKKVN